MFNNNIIVTGDLHGEWGYLNKLIVKKKHQIILQCGDFGFFPKWHNTSIVRSVDDIYIYGRKRRKKWNQYGIKPGNSIIRFAPGNHEDWLELIELEKTNKFEIMQNVFYQPFGSTITLDDGRTVMFCGGARSTDKNMRTLYFDWWPEEEISYKDLDKLPDCKVDIIISHTCPEEFILQMINKGIHLKNKKDSSRLALSYILNKYRPDLWYFGHFHSSLQGQFKNTRWFFMNMAGYARINWWVYLP